MVNGGTGQRATGRIALVTAAAKGIGRAVAERLGRDGADAVIAVDLDPDLDATCEVIRGFGAEAVPVVLDVTDEDAVRDTVGRLADSSGHIDILANCVGGGARDKATEFHLSEPGTWRTVLDRSLISAMLCTNLNMRHFSQVRT